MVAAATEDGELWSTVEWSSDGRHLLVCRRFADSTSGIWSVPIEGGQMRELIRFDEPARQPRPEMAVHGDEIYFTIGEFESDVWVVDLKPR